MRDYIEKLETANPLREPVLREVISVLQLSEGSHGLDAGCGIGLPTQLLAEAVGPNGHVTGLDLSAELLAHAEKLAQKAGLSGRLSFIKGNIEKLPFDDNSFDWIWSADCAGYPALDEPDKLIAELARVAKPGGIVAILAWSFERLLPGYPILEARLNATASGIAPFVSGRKPEYHFLRASGWFKKAGLVDIDSCTIAGSVHAPLDEKTNRAMISFLQMRWPNVRSELSEDDWALYQELCHPKSPDFILNCDDYYAFFTYTLFLGRVAD